MRTWYKGSSKAARPSGRFNRKRTAISSRPRGSLEHSLTGTGRMASSPQRLKRFDDAEVFTMVVFTMGVFTTRRMILNCSLAASLIWGLILGTLGISLQSGRAASREGVQKKTQIVLLGTGTPNADPDRSGPSVAIVVGDTPYIVDFGPGVVRRAAAAFRNGVAGLKVDKLKTAFVTHLHSDHTVGYPDLIFTPWTLDRKEPLEVYGPAGIKAMTRHILEAYKEDIAV